MRRVLRSPAILGEVKPRRVVLLTSSQNDVGYLQTQVCVSDGKHVSLLLCEFAGILILMMRPSYGFY